MATPAFSDNSIHTTYLWHLHQPIYWPDQRRGAGGDHYENAWDSIQQTDGGATHPENNLREIFGKDDRVAAYQYRTRDSISTLLGLADAGAQINYSGALMENVASLGFAGQLGYGSSWNGAINEARGWTTSDGYPRADIVNFSHHHAMLPLQSERTQWLQIRLHQELMQRNWGIAPGSAPGFFPTETCFSERMIPVLHDLGIEWSFVSNEHLSRACPDFPLILGSGGVNCDPPNLADQINPDGLTFWSSHIDRGCTPTNAYPFAYTPHRAQYVDPETGAIDSIVVVPTAQAISWDDGYGSIGANALDGIASGNNPTRPMLVVLAHDGDNAWGGGYSYYMEAVQNFSNDAASRGYSPSTVRQYLHDHPVPLDDIVHVEDGGWVNADSDFGSPTFINWLWPLLTADGQVDPINGWHYKAREYAIFTAAENRIRTAEDILGGPATTNIADVLDAESASASGVERAWSYYMASMDSGNVYYGNPLDMEIKGTVGCNEAMEHVDPIIAANPSTDTTDPTVMAPQRHPYNPGSVSFGAQYGYQQYINDGSFTVWTFAYDVSGIQSATLKYRIDVDGANPLSSIQNETYAGGAEVGAWQSIAMGSRTFPADNVHGWGGLEGYSFEMPLYIADHLWATVPAFNESLIDYYVEVTDTRGNTHRTAIQHVWVGDGSGSSGGSSRVTTDPTPLARGQAATIMYDPTGTALDGAPLVNIHYGFNNWDAGAGTDKAMSWNAGTDRWETVIDMRSDATQFDCVFNNGSGTWDNNGGNDWHLTVSEPVSPTGTALIVPNPPRATQSATLTFTPGEGPLQSAAQIFAHIEYNGGAVTVSPDQVMTFNSGESQWELDFNVDEAATSISVNFNDGSGATDDRNGSDWTWSVLPPPTGTPTLSPNPPVQGESVFLTFDPGEGPLSGAGAVNAVVSFSPTGGGTHAMSENAGRWEATVAVPGDATSMTLGFNDGSGTADDNNGSGWIYSISGGIMETVAVTPSPPVAGQICMISYEDEGRPIAGASQVNLWWGINDWQSVTETAMSFNSSNGRWEVSLSLGATVTELDFVFNNGSGGWDNNDQQDWKIPVTGSDGPAITLSTGAISTSATEGTDAGPTSFTVTNSGAGTLSYSLTVTYGDAIGWTDVRDYLLGLQAHDAAMNVNGDSVTDIADLVWLLENPAAGWLSLSPTVGASTGEADTISVTFDTDALAIGTHTATITASGNADNSPQTIDVSVTINPSAPDEPTIALSTSTLSPSAIEGTSPSSDSFTVTNSGTGTLTYSVALADTGDGTSWLSAAPPSGTSTGEADTITVSYSTAALTAGTYGARIDVTGNAGNSPQSVIVTLTLSEESTGPTPITIGNGPLIGTTAGQDWHEQFQDWNCDDVVALDEPFDAYEFNDGQDRSRDIIALYHRDDADGGNVYFRVDLYDLALAAEEGSVDIYVAIDFNSPGTGQVWLPDFTDCQTDTLWEVCVALYQSDAWSIYDSDFNVLSNSGTSPSLFLGSSYRSDLDSVEFGIARSVLIGEGWDGSSPLNFQAFTTRDGTDTGQAGNIVDHSDLTDAIADDDRGYGDGVLNGATASTATVTPLPFAYILHGNQSLNSSANLQDLIHSSTVQTPNGNPTGYHRALDTAAIFQAPPSIHVSATLAASLQWADRPGDTDPQDGPEFNQRIAEFLDGVSSNGEGALISGVYAEHIMPHFEGDNNLLSIDLNEEALEAVYGETIVPGQHVLWVPERVIRGTTFADIANAGYTHTVLDQYGHVQQWWGLSEAENNGHKIHRVNGVNFFLINNETDGNKFYPQDDGLNFDLRTSFINRALDTDDEQLILAFDDWEAYAGRSFTSFSVGNDNPDNWNRTVRWLTNHQWIEMTTLEEIASRGWTPVDHGIDTGLSIQTYDWLMHATHDDYDTWYYGSANEESFDDHMPAIRSDLSQFGDTRIGDIGTTGTLYRNISYNVLALLTSGGGHPNNLTQLARRGWVASIYETAWHDEDEPLESGLPDNTYDEIADWALKLNGLLARRVGILIEAAQWAQDPLSSTTTQLRAYDPDFDGETEWVIYNNRVWAVFENDGGRMIAAFVTNPATGLAHQVIGCPVANPDFSDEREGADNTSAVRTSVLKDWWAVGPDTNQYVNDVYSVVGGTNSFTLTSSDGRIVKTVSLADDSATLEVTYTVDPAISTLYIRNGLGPNVLDMLENGQANLTTSDTGGVFTIANSNGGSVALGYADSGHTGTTLNIAASDGSANSPRNHALTHMVELSGSGTFSFGLTLSAD